MMELNNWFQKGLDMSQIGIGGFSQAVLRIKPGLGGTQVYRKKRAIQKKKKLIDIGLRMSFGGYWKLFMDGNSLDIGFSGCLFLSINLYQMYNLHIPRPIACFLVFHYTAFTAIAVAFPWSFRLFPNERRRLTTQKLTLRIIRNRLISQFPYSNCHKYLPF